MIRYLPKNKIVFYALFLILAFATVIPFLYKAIYAPIKLIITLPDENKRSGDFWGNFPAPFVGKYNPILKEKSMVSHPDQDWGHGPIVHFITLPLTLIKSIKLFSITWLALNYIFLLLSILLILKTLKDLPAPVKFILIFLWMGYWPLYIAIQEDVIEIFELFMIILSLYYLYKKREALSGVLLGIAAMSKFLPAIFLPYLLIKKKYKAFFAMILTIIVITLATQVTLRWQDSNTMELFLREAFKEKHYWTNWRGQTIPCVVERMFSKPADYTEDAICNPVPGDFKYVKVISNTITLLILSFICFILYKRRKTKDYITEYGLITVLMILIPSHSHHYYFIFCLIGYSAAVRFFCKEKYDFGLALFIISYILTGYIMQLNFLDVILGNHVRRSTFFYFLSFPAYGLVLLFILLVNVYMRNKADE